MIEHILFPSVNLSEVEITPAHKRWLQDWLETVLKNVSEGITASSICLQGVISEIALYKKVQTDWTGILDFYLRGASGEYLAYSEEFGKLLNGFNQWKQSPVHAIHAHWWIRGIENKIRSENFGAVIESFIQANGWIYNPSVSQTKLRTRMKSEIFMSQLMGIEILKTENMLKEEYRLTFEAALNAVPMTGYASAEYFRARTLQLLGRLELVPSSVSDICSTCEAGIGYCDFSLESKVDDYMGTAKRTARDKVIPSPLISLYVAYIAAFSNEIIATDVKDRLNRFGKYLFDNPLDIPAFRMRDIDVPFGNGITPLEVIAASVIISRQ